MVICAIVGCSERSDRHKSPGISFFNLPVIICHQGQTTKELSEKRRTEWLARINRTQLDPKSLTKLKVCSKHFIAGKPAALYNVTDPNWSPSLELGYGNKDSAKKSSTTARHERCTKRNASENYHGEFDIDIADAQYMDTDLHLQADNASHSENNTEDRCEKGTETDLSMEDMNRLENDWQYLQRELHTMHDKSTSESLDQSSFEKNDEKVLFYTGLPNFTLLIAVFNFISAAVFYSNKNKLTQFKEFMLVMMRLRLNLPLQDLAYRFGIGNSTVSRIIDKWLEVMFVRLQNLIYWPERELLQKTMPMHFRASFGTSVAVIIDCFEVFIERPSSLDSRAATWSQYKHHNTIKFLIGITPQGAVSFLSRAWGGRTTDKYLTENSGILNKLLPGDVVLADRGFDIADSVGFYCAKLAIPAFTRGKKQLPSLEVNKTRKIANVRIHVERVIGAIRQKYQILHGILPIDLLTCKEGEQYAPIDKIATICCALTNLSDSVVPFT